MRSPSGSRSQDRGRRVSDSLGVTLAKDQGRAGQSSFFIEAVERLFMVKREDGGGKED